MSSFSLSFYLPVHFIRITVRAVVIPNFDILRRGGREFFRVLAGVRLALKLELIVVAGLSRAYERGRTTNE